MNPLDLSFALSLASSKMTKECLQSTALHAYTHGGQYYEYGTTNQRE